MQKVLTADATLADRDPPLDVEILSIATAVPAHRISQQEVSDRAQRVFPNLARLEGLYTNTGIDIRYSCEPAPWYHEHRTWEEKTAAFKTHALSLLEQVAAKATASAGLEIGDIDVVVVNTITGLAVPSLDALLMNRLPFREDVERLPIFGFGCGGGVAGLSRAAQLARARSGANVLFLTVDLCSLCLRVNDQSLVMFVATALFGDGAAGVVLRARGTSETAGLSGGGRIAAVGEHFWRMTEHIMGWDIKSDGFGVVLSPDLPSLLRERLRPAIEAFLARKGMTLEELDGFLFHPGGRKLLEGIETIFGLSRDDLAHSWGILRDYGNVSSATALFVLERALASGAKGRHLLSAFGPGFSAYFAVVDL